MATYVVGDVQGCFITLERLLARIDFDASQDRLWFVGDLVNRGPSSLEVLRFVRALGASAITVLGNHDLHLIERRRGSRAPRRHDTFDDVLEAADGDALIDWLVERPLLHRNGDAVMVHAGILPTWSLAEAERLAKKASAALRDGGVDGKLRRALDGLTRLRTCSKDGEMCLDYAGPPRGAPKGCRPWFEMASLPDGVMVYFGHWASLGLYLGTNAIGLDTGCVWGRSLTAMRLEDREVFQEPSEIGAGR